MINDTSLSNLLQRMKVFKDDGMRPTNKASVMGPICMHQTN